APPPGQEAQTGRRRSRPELVADGSRPCQTPRASTDIRVAAGTRRHGIGRIDRSAQRHPWLLRSIRPKRAAERSSSAAGPAATPSCLGKPICRPGRLQHPGSARPPSFRALSAVRCRPEAVLLHYILPPVVAPRLAPAIGAPEDVNTEAP